MAGGRLHAATPGPPVRRGSAAAVGEALRSRPLDARAGPSRRFGTFAGARHAREAAETLRAVTGEAEGQPLGAGKALPGPQEDHLSPRRRERESFAMDTRAIAKLLVVKTQAKSALQNLLP